MISKNLTDKWSKSGMLSEWQVASYAKLPKTILRNPNNPQINK